MSGLRETAIRKALYRYPLVLGGDRKMVLLSLVISGSLALSAMNRVAFVIGFLIAVISVYGLRKMATHDPMLWPVYIRVLKYKRYYAPYSRPWRVAQSKNGVY